MRLGLINYDHPHLKTEQLVNKYLRDNRIEDITIFGLPLRKGEKASHKNFPSAGYEFWNSNKAVWRSEMFDFKHWDGKEIIGDYCLILFVIAGGAGILDVNCMKNKPVVNAHPGIIPMTRGLDSFKWAIYNGSLSASPYI